MFDLMSKLAPDKLNDKYSFVSLFSKQTNETELSLTKFESKTLNENEAPSFKCLL